jgi:uncharacterized cupin superfamily protein
MGEARLQNGVPQTAGWFVVNARDVPWLRDGLPRTYCRFGGQGEAHFDQLGIALYWLAPGEPMALYHDEAGQEDFLVLQGECTLIAEGVERVLRAFDFVHCPPRTPHTIVGAGEEPALVLAVGARVEKFGARYPHDAAAARHGASAPRDIDAAEEAYAGVAEPQRVVTPLPPA